MIDLYTFLIHFLWNIKKNEILIKVFFYQQIHSSETTTHSLLLLTAMCIPYVLNFLSSCWKVHFGNSKRPSISSIVMVSFFWGGRGYQLGIVDIVYKHRIYSTLIKYRSSVDIVDSERTCRLKRNRDAAAFIIVSQYVYSIISDWSRKSHDRAISQE